MDATTTLLKMKEDSLLIAGLPCCSFVFMNAFTSGRSVARPLGYHESPPHIRTANLSLDC